MSGAPATDARGGRRPEALGPSTSLSHEARFRLPGRPAGLRRARRKRGDPQGGDAVALLAQHLEAKAVKAEGLVRLGNRARLVDDEAGDGRRLVVGQIPVHRAVEVADRRRAVDDDRSVALLAHALRGTSCSSLMSPTISSMMSSSVIRPCTTPYSSTTSAEWVLRRRKACSWSRSVVASGMNQGSSAMSAILSGWRRRPPRHRRGTDPWRGARR